VAYFLAKIFVRCSARRATARPTITLHADKMIHKYSSSLGTLTAHVSFKTKYCHRIFKYPRIKARCEEIFREVSAEYGFLIVELGFDNDHVHLIIDAGVRYSMSEIAHALKGASARKILAEFPTLKRVYFWGSGMWNPTIYFDSVGERTENSAQHYVAMQGYSREVKRNPGQQSILGYV